MDQRTGGPRPRRIGPDGLVVGRVAGAPVVLAPWWPLGVLVLGVLYVPVARDALAGWVTGPDGRAPAALVVLVTVAFLVLVLGSVVLHEVAHAVVARAHGHAVRDVRLTAWGGRTAYDPRGATPRSHLRTALAGPAVNVVLGLVCGAGTLALGTGATSAVAGVTAEVLLAGAVANAGLAVLNLLPALPFDGGAVLEALVWRATGRRETATRLAASSGHALAVVLVVAVVAVPLLVRARPSAVLVVWVLVLAVFVWSGASGALASAATSARAARLDPARVVRPASLVDPAATIDDALSTLLADGVRAVVVLDALGRPLAWADGAALGAVPAAGRSGHVLEAATMLAPAPPVDAALTGTDLFEAVRASAGAPVVVAHRRGEVVGIVVVTDVVAALREPGRGRPRRGPSRGN